MSLFISLNHLCNSISSNLCLIMLIIPASEKCVFPKDFLNLYDIKSFDFLTPKNFIFNLFFVIIGHLR